MALVEQGSTVTIEWEAFDINSLNGPLAPGGHFDLHYLIPEEGLPVGWHEIVTAVPASVGVEQYSHNWFVDASEVPAGQQRRIRLTTVDAGGNQNVAYSPQLVVVPPGGMIAVADLNTNDFVVPEVVPNPASGIVYFASLSRSKPLVSSGSTFTTSAGASSDRENTDDWRRGHTSYVGMGERIVAVQHPRGSTSAG